MKSKFILSICMAMIYTIAFAQPTPPNGKRWVKVDNLSDEFNGGFDTSKWSKSLWDYPNTPTKMIAQNSGVSGGNLWIRATEGSGERWFQSSRVTSVAQIKYPMYTESRIITAHLSAYNTFWLNNGDINDRDEIDVIENNSRPSCNCQPNFPWQMNSQYFQATNGFTVRNADNFDNRNLSNGNPKKGVRWNEQYHTVGVWWKDRKNMTFYLDGERAGSVTVGEDRSGRTYPEIIFARNLNLIWDLWTADQNFLGGLAVRSHLRNNNINTMKVDWVRTYRLVDGNDGGGGGGGGGGNGDAFLIQSEKSRKWVSPINGSSNNGAAVVNHPVETGNARQWRFVDRDGDGYTEVINVRSGRCLGVAGGNLSNGGKIVQWNCNGNKDQQWRRLARDNGEFSFVNLNSGKCLDLANGNTNNNVQFHQWNCSATNRNQRFYILSPNRAFSSDDIAVDGQLAEIIATKGKQLNISNLDKGKIPIAIYNMAGQEILTKTLNSGGDDVIINLNHLNSGVYAIKINSNTYKFVIGGK